MSSHHVLVVDDEPAQRQVLAGFLRKRGYEVTEAAADAALTIVARETADLVLSDIRMPGRSGAELLARSVRSIRKCPSS